MNCRRFVGSVMRVLVIDDDPFMLDMMEMTLAAAGASQIDMAENGPAGLRLLDLHAGDIELVVIDWNMPEMNGIDLLRTLNRRYSNVNLGFITSQVTQEMKIKAQENGSLFFLSKPFTQEQFKWTLGPYLEN